MLFTTVYRDCADALPDFRTERLAVPLVGGGWRRSAAAMRRMLRL